MWDSAIFDGWSGLARVAIGAIAAYAALVAMLRLSGKRTLSKLNAFDLVVTVALGSTLASTITSKDLALAEGLLSLALLIGLQFVVSWTSVRWSPISRLVKSEPAVLLRGGACIGTVMRRERVAHDEVLAAIRESGGRSYGDADVVLLESDGSLTAILRPAARSGERGPEPPLRAPD